MQIQQKHIKAIKLQPKQKKKINNNKKICCISEHFLRRQKQENEDIARNPNFVARTSRTVQRTTASSNGV